MAAGAGEYFTEHDKRENDLFFQEENTRIELNLNEKYFFLLYFSKKFMKLAPNLSLLDPFFSVL